MNIADCRHRKKIHEELTKKNRSIKPSPTHLSSVAKESYFFTILGHSNTQFSSFFTSKPKFVSCFQDNLSYLQKGLCNLASRGLFLAFIGWSTIDEIQLSCMAWCSSLKDSHTLFNLYVLQDGVKWHSAKPIGIADEVYFVMKNLQAIPTKF